MRISEGGGVPKPKAPTKELGFKQLDKDGDNKLNAEELKDSKKFQGFDKNNNGEVTRDEALMGARAKESEDKVKKALSKYDSNKDGNLSGNELNKVKAFDSNKDGKISKDEVKAGSKQFDDNGDGKVDAKEFQTNRAENRKKALDDKFDKAFAKLDENKDGKLSGNESKNKKFDKDGDGEISKEEFNAGKLQQHRDQKHGVETKKLEKQFDKLDKTEDGWLSGNESNKYRSQFDADGNGEITKQEFVEGRQELAKLKRQAELLGDDPKAVRLEKKEPPAPTGGRPAPGVPI